MADRPSTACPVCVAYFRALRTSGLDDLLYADLVPRVEFLERQADVAGSERALQQLRSFLCIELMCTRIGPYTLKNAGNDEAKEKWTRVRFDRSWKGLTKLLRGMEDLADELEADGLDLRIGYTKGVGSAAGMLSGHLEKASGIYDLTMKAIRDLRPALRNESLPLAPFGRHLAEVCEIADETMQERVDYGAMLINISQEKAPRAWETSRT